MALNLNEHTKYLLIEFIDENSFVPTNKKNIKKVKLISVEVVPVSWVFSKQNKLYCYYPPDKNKNEFEESIKNEVVPKADWNDFPIRIVQEAREYI